VSQIETIFEVSMTMSSHGSADWFSGVRKQEIIIGRALGLITELKDEVRA
jgi:hypothetical protein